MKRENMIWSERKRNALGLPWTFTVYGLAEDRLFVKSGVLTVHEDEVRLYRILDLRTIHVVSSDKTLKNFDITNIRRSADVMEQISELVEKERDRKRVASREFMSGGYDDDGQDDDGYDDDLNQ